MAKYANFLLCFVLGGEPGGATAEIARKRRDEFARFKFILKLVLVAGFFLAVWALTGFDIPQ